MIASASRAICNSRKFSIRSSKSSGGRFFSDPADVPGHGEYGFLMTFDDFRDLISAHTNPVVLLEGRREIPESIVPAARRFAFLLSTSFPSMRFRSGNAPGTDAAFASGINDHDSNRLELFLPHIGHRKAVAGPRTLSVGSLTPESRVVVAESAVEASPRNRGLFDSKVPRLRAKGNYLLRDTLKVTGYGSAFPPPVAGFFYADPDDPMAGGTGHTIRVCRNHGVPVILQQDWLGWIPDLESGKKPGPPKK